MPPQICSRCLVRASTIGPINLALPRQCLPSASTNFFSTSGSLLAQSSSAATSKRMNKVPVKGQKLTFSKKKKKPEADRGKRPGIGERKALRKRVVLSNTNALPVKDIEEISRENVADPASVGTVVGIPDELVDRLRAVQAFKPSQAWSLFSRPTMVLRPETIEYGNIMQDTSKAKKVTRRVIVGERMTGKTVMLLQVMAIAMLRGWVVINIPDAMDLTIANTDYAPYPTPTSTPLQYTQPAYTASLLLSISRANPILQTLQLSSQPAREPESNLPSLPPDMTLARLCQLGAETPESAWAIFQLLLSELKQPDRPPLLFALDGLGFAMRETKYIDGKQYKPIHAHCFTLISTFLTHLSGTSPLPNGGMVLAAVSESNRPNVEALSLALEQIEKRGKVEKDPFKKYDERVMGVFQGPDGQGRGIEVQRLSGLSKDESRALMEYWAKSGIVRGKVGATEVAEKWGIAGGGVVGELERACFRRMV